MGIKPNIEILPCQSYSFYNRAIVTNSIRSIVSEYQTVQDSDHFLPDQYVCPSSQRDSRYKNILAKQSRSQKRAEAPVPPTLSPSMLSSSTTLNLIHHLGDNCAKLHPFQNKSKVPKTINFYFISTTRSEYMNEIFQSNDPF